MPRTPGATDGADAQFNADAQVKLETAHDILQHPDKFAAVFIAAAETQISVKQLIRKEIKDSLALDPDSRNSLKGLIAEQFKEDWRAFIKSAWAKVWLLAWTVVVALVTGWAVHAFIK